VKPEATDFEAKPRETIIISFKVKPGETVTTSFEAKPKETTPVVLRSNH
jgi:hypothetical protein